MPSYFPKINDTPIGFSSEFTKILSPGTQAASTILISIGVGGAQQNSHWLTDAWVINSDQWESGGTFTCKLNVVSSANCRARCQIRRVDSAGNLLQGGTLTAFQTITGGGVFTFTPSVPTWTSAQEACSNKLAIRFNYDAILAANPANATIELGTVNSEIVTTITENNGNCRRIFIS